MSQPTNLLAEFEYEKEVSAGLRAELAQARKATDDLRAGIVAIFNCGSDDLLRKLQEIARQSDEMEDELIEARKSTEEAQAKADKLRRDCLNAMEEKSAANNAVSVIKHQRDDLAAELRRAVAALRRIRDAIGVALTGSAAPVNFRAELAQIDIVVAAYDAKHGNVCNIE